MQINPPFTFGPYRFAPQTGQLWRGTQEVRLTPKATALLRILIDRAGLVVSKEKLFQTMWSNTVVSDAALTSCMQELPQALRDNARQPRYIETVHRHGFRFLGKAVSRQEEERKKSKDKNQKTKVENFSPAPNTQHPTPVLVGRDTDLTHLHRLLENALSGTRQFVFITGEPGIGKTALLDVFVSSVRGPASKEESQKSKIEDLTPRIQHLTPGLWVGRGQCIEHYGAGEAYLPILEALGRLCRGPEGHQLIAVLQQHAPTWLVQMPALLSAADLEGVQRKTAGATRERMLRELAEALEVVTREQPLALVLEDLHWSDVSTLDFLSMLARRQEPARLLVCGTYRPVEVLTRNHPLKGIKQELQLHRQCEELALDFLTERHVEEYLAVTFARGMQQVAPLQQLARFIHQRTDGNPLFMVNVTKELLAQGVVRRNFASFQSLGEMKIGVPTNLHQLIEQQIERVSADGRKILETASVAGAEFPAAAVAAGTEQRSARRVDIAHQEKYAMESEAVSHAHPTEKVEACFLKAIEIAQNQKAKSWELRATTSLARLWQHQGKKKQAHTLLSDIYNWFTEGFDTKDLQEAKALIEDLGGQGKWRIGKMGRTEG